MKATEIRIGNIVHNPIWGKDIIVDLENINYHEDFIPVRIDGEKLLSAGFEQHNENYQIDTLHGLLTKKPSKLVIKHTKAFNWVVTRPGNRTIYVHSINEIQNLFYCLTGREILFNFIAVEQEKI